MIQQAADCANGKANPPPELTLIWKCRQFGCLPEAGGYNQQDDITMTRAGMYERVYNFIKRNRRGKEPMNVAEMDEADRAMFDWLREQEIKF